MIQLSKFLFSMYSGRRVRKTRKQRQPKPLRITIKFTKRGKQEIDKGNIYKGIQKYKTQIRHKVQRRPKPRIETASDVGGIAPANCSMKTVNDNKIVTPEEREAIVSMEYKANKSLCSWRDLKVPE